MEESHSLALIVGYYLSKFDKTAYTNLGLGGSTETHRRIGRILGVKPTLIKNMRDEFDPLHDNPRVGWYQRPLAASRAKVVEQFQDLGEEELRDVVLEILSNPRFESTENFSDVVGPVARRARTKKGEFSFVVR